MRANRWTRVWSRRSWTCSRPCWRESAAADHAAPAGTADNASIEDAAAVGAVRGAKSAFENIALAHREINALYEIAQAMGASLGVADTMALISEKMAKIVPWSGCALFLYRQEDDLLECSFASGLDTPRLRKATFSNTGGLESWVARTHRSVVNSDPRVTFEAAGLQDGTALRSAMACPLFANNSLLGVLSVYHTDANYYTDDHRRLLERVADQVGTGLHNAIVFDQTQEEAMTDALTGLPNRRSMLIRLASELSRANRLGSPTSLIVLDIDDFKKINDTHGHHVGDMALCEVAKTLGGVLRPYDLCVRYAGDEFVLVLANCDREVAEAKCEELQNRVSEIEMEIRPGEHIRFGVSAGAAVFPEDGATSDALITTADRRMYEDKAARRHGPRGSRRHSEAHFPPTEPEPALELSLAKAPPTVQNIGRHV